MKYLIFDTETHGLPKDYKAPAEDSNNWPRVLQLAWQLHDENGDLVQQRCELIKPHDWTITDTFSIKNGFTTENNDLKGVPLPGLLQEFIEVRKNAAYSIGHNISYDAKILRAEMIRYGMTTEFTAEKICTMMKSTSLCQIPNAKGNGFKWPKLEELYFFLFKEKIDGAHDAGVDVAATARCFFELKKRGVITV